MPIFDNEARLRVLSQPVADDDEEGKIIAVQLAADGLLKVSWRKGMGREGQILDFEWHRPTEAGYDKIRQLEALRDRSSLWFKVRSALIFSSGVLAERIINWVFSLV